MQFLPDRLIYKKANRLEKLQPGQDWNFLTSEQLDIERLLRSTLIARESTKKRESLIEMLEKGQKFSKGIWRLDVTGSKKIKVTDKYGSTVYHFLNGMIEENNLLPVDVPFEHKLDLIDALIYLARQLNPGTDLDDFKSVENKSIVFPLNIRIMAARAGHLDMYEDMQMLAKLDGYPVDDRLQQQAIYNAALRDATHELPLKGNGFYRHPYALDDSPRKVPEDVHRIFMKIANNFNENTNGWSISYYDVLRDPELQKMRKAGTRKGSTHLTGRSIDIGDSRFLDPDGHEVTWSGSDSKTKKFIEETLRPELDKQLRRYGLAYFNETGHRHTYFPGGHLLQLEIPREWYFNMNDSGISSESSTDAPDKPRFTPVPMSELPLESTGHLLFSDQSKKTHSNARRAYNKFMIKYGEMFKGVDYPYSRLLKFARIDMAEVRVAYRNYALDKAQKEINKLVRKGGDQDSINELVLVRNHKIYLGFMSMVSQFPSSAIEEIKLLKGTVLFQPRRGYRSDRLGDAWRYKKEKKGGSEVRRYANHLPSMDKLDGKFTLAKWESAYARTNSVLKKNLDKLGVNSEMAAYVDKRVFLAIVHAEFFSEMNADIYLRMLPIVFSTYNIMYSPAVNDRLFSGGLVQMTASTMRALLSKYGATVRRIRSSIKIKAPKPSDDKGVVDVMLLEPDSVVFWQQVVALDHIKLASNRLMKDSDFKSAWNKASKRQRHIFVGGLSAMAINAGANGARKIANNLVSKKQSTLDGYMADLPKSAQRVYGARGKGQTTSRGAHRGLETVQRLFEKS